MPRLPKLEGIEAHHIPHHGRLASQREARLPAERAGQLPGQEHPVGHMRQQRMRNAQRVIRQTAAVIVAACGLTAVGTTVATAAAQPPTQFGPGTELFDPSESAQGASVALSANGTTALVGAPNT